MAKAENPPFSHGRVVQKCARYSFSPELAAWGHEDFAHRGILGPWEMEVSVNGGTQKWMVYFMKNPISKWMITRGTPILGTPQMGFRCWLSVCLYPKNMIQSYILRKTCNSMFLAQVLGFCVGTCIFKRQGERFIMSLYPRPSGDQWHDVLEWRVLRIAHRQLSITASNCVMSHIPPSSCGPVDYISMKLFESIHFGSQTWRWN